MTGNLFDLLQRLSKAGVDFVTVGGFAGVVHGCTCVTQDIDICCDFSADNLLRLQEALKDVDAVHRMTANRRKLQLTRRTCARFKNLYLDTDIGQLDCMSFIDGLGDYEAVRKVSIGIDVEGTQLYVLSVDALIKSKKAMRRPRDKEAVLELEAIKKLKGE